MAAPAEDPTPRFGGDAWVLAFRALADRPLLTAGFVLLTAAMEWLQAAAGLDDGTRGMLLGDLLPNLVELGLVAALAIAVHRAVILEERRSVPPWRQPVMHLVFMGWLVALGVLWDGSAAAIGYNGTGFVGLAADLLLLAAGGYGAIRLTLLLPTIALTGSGGWSMVRGAWGMTRGHALWMLLTFLITGAPLLGLGIVLAVLGVSAPMLSLPATLLFAATGRAIVLAVSAALASLFFIAYSRRPASAATT